jgi:hypothetical protein
MYYIVSEAMCILANYIYSYNKENQIILCIREELKKRNYQIIHRCDITIRDTDQLIKCTIGNGLLHSFNDRPAITICSIAKRRTYDKYDTMPRPPNNATIYYKYGKLHREGGPAVIYPNGLPLYYRDGMPVSYN